jgi:ligand-binding sensor domain-containing protein/signal transduction histidine kinase
MIKQIIVPGVFFCIAACTSSHEPVTDFSLRPHSVPANGYSVPKESYSKPVITPAGKPGVVRIGHKKEFSGSMNIHLAAEPQNIGSLNPVVLSPGKDGVKLPEQHKALINPILCKAPEMVLVKEAYTKDINPENFSSYSKLQGLKHDQIRSLTQDRTGNLWLGSDDGLIKYDGKYFSRYSTNQGLNNDLILSVIHDRNDNIWFGSYGGGVTKYDGRYLISLTTREGLKSDVVNCLFEDDKGNIWFGTGGGVTRFDGTFITNFTIEEGLCSNDVRSITQDNDSKIWIATSGGGISVYDGEKFTNYSSKGGLIHNNVNVVFKDSSGNIWLGFSSKGLLKFNGNDFEWFSVKEGLNHNNITSIVQDNQGSMWFGTMEAGLSKYDGKYFTYYSEQEGLSAKFIRCSIKDSNGYLWFGTRGGGITRFDGNIFTHLTTNEGLSNSRVMAIMEDKSGDLWLGTFGGYITKCSFRNTNGISQRYFTYYDESDGLPNNRIYSIIGDKNGNIWIGTDGGGVTKFDGRTMSTYTTKQGLGSNTIRKIYEDRDGNLWFATYGFGVTKYDGVNFTVYTEKQGLSGNNVLSILQDTEGKFWFATDNKGITCFDADNIIHYSKKQGLSTNTIYSILEDRYGDIWFGTGGGGIVRYDGSSFTSYTDDDELNNNYVLSLLLDSHDNIWFGTRFGPTLLKGTSINRDTDNLVMPLLRSYSYDDGFIGIGCNIGAIAESKSGIIWIGTNDRLTAFHPEGEKSITTPPVLQMTGIQLFNEDIAWTQLLGIEDTTIVLHNGVEVGKIRFSGILKWNGLPDNLSLRYNNNFLTFNYIGISITQNRKINYQYKLDGLDENWIAPTSRTEASYGNLSPGKYIFRVRAINDDGSWSNEVTYPFAIRAPWWETGWFYLIVIIGVSLSIYYLFRYRLRKLNIDKQLLEKKVLEQTREISQKNQELLKMNTEKDKFFSIIAHDLRSPFSGFLGLTQQMAEDLPDFKMEELQDIAIRLKTSASSIYALLENLLVWARIQQGQISYKPQKVQLSLIINESISSLLDAAKNKKIVITINIDENLFVDADNNMLQTVIRNLVSNAVKFTPEHGSIVLSAMSTSQAYTEITVRDSGIGMNPSMLEKMFRIEEKINRKGTTGEPSTGLGLILCKEFIEMHSGSIWVESEEGKGSVFHFTIPSVS